MKRLLVGLALTGSALGLGAAPALAQESPYGDVLGVTESNTPPAQQVAPQAQQSVQSSQTLPVTGGDVLGLAAIGGTALAGGAALMVARRRKAEA